VIDDTGRPVTSSKVVSDASTRARTEADATASLRHGSCFHRLGGFSSSTLTTVPRAVVRTVCAVRRTASEPRRRDAV
jgi:hypothetical protein